MQTIQSIVGTFGLLALTFAISEVRRGDMTAAPQSAAA
jgi:hypothetical protein